MSIKSEYHEQGTEMGMQEIGIELNDALGQFERGAHNMCPDEVALFLRISSEALVNYIHNSNDQLGEDSMGFVPPMEIDKINFIFRELIDNFFPMAHTNRPLSELKIIETVKVHIIRDFISQSNAIEAQRQGLNTNFFNMLGHIDV
jgi:hypothetical protein